VPEYLAVETTLSREVTLTEALPFNSLISRRKEFKRCSHLTGLVIFIIFQIAFRTPLPMASCRLSNHTKNVIG